MAGCRSSLRAIILAVLALLLVPSAAADAPSWAKYIPGYNATAAGSPNATAVPDWVKWLPKAKPPDAGAGAPPAQASPASEATPAAPASADPVPLATLNATTLNATSAPSPARAAAAQQVLPVFLPSTSQPGQGGTLAASSDARTSIPQNAPLAGLGGELASTGVDAASGRKGERLQDMPGLEGGQPVTAPSLPLLTPQGREAAPSGALGRGGELSSAPGLPAKRGPAEGGARASAEAAPGGAAGVGASGSAAAVGAPAQLELVDAPWAKFIPHGVMPGGAPGGAPAGVPGGTPGGAPAVAPGGANSSSPAADPASSYIPQGAMSGGAPGGAGGSMPSSASGYMPFKPAPMPARHMPPRVNGTWQPAEGAPVPLEARYVGVSAFMGGFIGAVQVLPWTPGAIIVLNFTGTDAVLQRLWNGDILDEQGEQVGAFSLLTGKSGQTFIVRLHNASVPSSAGSPPDSFSFMASGTAQGPEMAVGCGWVDPQLLAPAGVASSLLRYHLSPYEHPGGFLASVEVVPWVVGEEVTLDYGDSGVRPSWWHNARLLRADGSAYTVELLPFSRSDDELTPDSSFLVKAAGSSSGLPAPKLTRQAPANATEDGADKPTLLLLLTRAGSGGAGGAAWASGAPALVAAFVAGSLLALAAFALVRRAQRRPGGEAGGRPPAGKRALVARALDGWRACVRGGGASAQPMLAAAILEEDAEDEAEGAYFAAAEPGA